MWFGCGGLVLDLDLSSSVQELVDDTVSGIQRSDGSSGTTEPLVEDISVVVSVSGVVAVCIVDMMVEIEVDADDSEVGESTR